MKQAECKIAFQWVAVIGGGIVGLAAAMIIGEPFSDAAVLLFEKELQVGMHQTGNNSDVLHAGLYYEPGPLKAKLAVRAAAKSWRSARARRCARDLRPTR